MTRIHSSLSAVFEAYGADAEAALAALANLDPPLWSSYVDAAAAKQYLADYARHRRSLLSLVRKDDVTKRSGQPRLFEVPDSVAVLRAVAQRDLAPATTAVSRCRLMLRLADHVEAEMRRLGRDVTVAEVLHLERAA